MTMSKSLPDTETQASTAGIAKKNAAAVRFSSLLLLFEIAMILIFAFTADYQHSIQASSVVGDGGYVVPGL